jgi:SAM-dependent methyltransferase
MGHQPCRGHARGPGLGSRLRQRPHLRALADLGAEPVGVDVSAGTLASAPRFDRVAADAVRLPFPAACFDTVMAPHMLYHVGDRVTAARELRRVLRPGGTCVAVTNGAGHLASLRVLVEDALGSASPGWRWTDPLGKAFSLENGTDPLAVAFDRVACERPASPGRAVVTDADVVAGYLASMADLYGPQTPLPWEQVVEAVTERVGQQIATDGRFVVQGDVGAIVAR